MKPNPIFMLRFSGRTIPDKRQRRLRLPNRTNTPTENDWPMPSFQNKQPARISHPRSCGQAMLLWSVVFGVCWGYSAWNVPGAVAADLKAAREKVESMEPEHKQDLLRRHQEFTSLEPEEQQRIRRLHRQLSEDPQGQELRQTMHRYHAWLNTLPTVTRYELRDLEPAQRIERVKQLIEHSQRSPREPTAEDLAGLRRWFHTYVGKMQSQFAERMPKERRSQFARLGDAERRWLATRLILNRGRNPSFLGAITTTDREEIRNHLTPSTRAWLEKRPAGEQGRIVTSWVREAMRPKPPGEEPPPALGEHLDRFFMTLGKEQQDRLMRMPPEEMQQELLGLFFAQMGGREGPMHHRGGPFAGGRSGPGRPRGPDDRTPPFQGPFRRSPEGGPPRYDRGPPPDGPRPEPDESPADPRMPDRQMPDRQMPEQP